MTRTNVVTRCYGAIADAGFRKIGRHKFRLMPRLCRDRRFALIFPSHTEIVHSFPRDKVSNKTVSHPRSLRK